MYQGVSIVSFLEQKFRKIHDRKNHAVFVGFFQIKDLLY